MPSIIDKIIELCKELDLTFTFESMYEASVDDTGLVMFFYWQIENVGYIEIEGSDSYECPNECLQGCLEYLEGRLTQGANDEQST